MRRFVTVLAACGAIAAAAAPALAQGMALDRENGRYSFTQVPDGLVRLDSRTGQVSLCSKLDAGWACQAMPDDRAALESEIARLQEQNVKLKQELISRGLPLPGGMRSEPRVVKPDDQLKMPSDADVDRMMSFLEKVWRRLVDMVQNTPRDQEKKPDPKGTEPRPQGGKG